MLDARLRAKVADAEVESLIGKVLTEEHYDLLLTGPSFIRKPNNQPLVVFLPGALKARTADPEVYRVLHGLKGYVTKNRGPASGTKRVNRAEGRIRTEAKPVPSALIGAVDPMGATRYCRLTAWTGSHLPQWETLHPMLRQIADLMALYVPDRYKVQTEAARRTDPAWVIDGTPFTTVTVNNTYPTGVHRDAGDLAEGFSTLAVTRRGGYTGGQLVFPQYRVAADLHDGDLLLMDAHELHGNVAITCACGSKRSVACDTCGAERISLVSYFRTRMQSCGSPDEEFTKAVTAREGTRNA
jgi:hypothetical protein